MNEHVNLINLIRSRFVELQTRNPNYSIRAYAKKLGMGASTLSMLLSGQRRCSRKSVVKIADRLLFDPAERALVIKAVNTKKNTSPHHLTGQVLQTVKISTDQYAVYSQASYVAILNLIRLKTFQNNPQWIAERIGTTPALVKVALERLKRLGMITEDGEGNLSRTHPSFRTTDDVANLSLKKAHFENLEVARKSLENDSVQSRDFTMVTLAVKESRMQEMKEFVRKFQNEYMERFGEDADADQVYRLSMQIVPLTHTPQTKNKEGKKK